MIMAPLWGGIRVSLQVISSWSFSVFSRVISILLIIVHSDEVSRWPKNQQNSLKTSWKCLRKLVKRSPSFVAMNACSRITNFS